MPPLAYRTRTKRPVLFFFCSRVPWLYQYWPGGFMIFGVLCPGTTEGSTGKGSGFKASQKTGQRLKVSSDRLGEAGNRTCDPWFTRHRFIFQKPRRLFILYCLWPCSLAVPVLAGWVNVFCVLWPGSLAVPVLAGWVYAFGGSMSRNSRRLNQQWFWF